MVERSIRPEGGMVFCDLGRMCPECGQVIEASLQLTQVLPQRRLAVAVELLEGENCLGMRLLTLPPLPGNQAADTTVTGIRFYLPEPAEGVLTLRADAHYIDRKECCLIPEA